MDRGSQHAIRLTLALAVLALLTPPAAVADEPIAVAALTQKWVGRLVRVHFRQQDQISPPAGFTGTVDWLTGTIDSLPAGAIEMHDVRPEQTPYWIPLASIAYIEVVPADDAVRPPTTMPAPTN